MLLIWDNFETVLSMPDRTGATPALDATQRNELRAFVDRLAGGRERARDHQPRGGGVAG